MARVRYVVEVYANGVWDRYSAVWTKRQNAEIFAENIRIHDNLLESHVLVKRIIAFRHSAADDWAVGH